MLAGFHHIWYLLHREFRRQGLVDCGEYFLPQYPLPFTNISVNMQDSSSCFQNRGISIFLLLPSNSILYTFKTENGQLPGWHLQ